MPNLAPKVSVVMPVFNAEAYLAKAIRSILEQSYRDFELLMINDGSSDKSAEIMSSFKDPRIRIITNEYNTGLREVLNQGVRESHGTYIARMDSDDIARGDRLSKQVAFLDTHPDFIMVGTQAEIINENDKATGIAWKESIASEEMPSALLFHNRFVHPSILVRKNALPPEPFRAELTPAEDYDLWLRLSKAGKLWNLPQILLYYRQHGKNISLEKSQEKNSALDRIAREQLNILGINASGEEILIHRTNYGYKGDNLEKFLEAREQWLRRLIDANNTSKQFDSDIFKKVVARQWLISCAANTGRGVNVWKKFWRSELRAHLVTKRNLKTLGKFAFNSFLKRTRPN